MHTRIFGVLLVAGFTLTSQSSVADMTVCEQSANTTENLISTLQPLRVALETSYAEMSVVNHVPYAGGVISELNSDIQSATAALNAKVASMRQECTDPQATIRLAMSASQETLQTGSLLVDRFHRQLDSWQDDLLLTQVNEHETESTRNSGNLAEQLLGEAALQQVASEEEDEARFAATSRAYRRVYDVLLPLRDTVVESLLSLQGVAASGQHNTLALAISHQMESLFPDEVGRGEDRIAYGLFFRQKSIFSPADSGITDMVFGDSSNRFGMRFSAIDLENFEVTKFEQTRVIAIVAYLQENEQRRSLTGPVAVGSLISFDVSVSGPPSDKDALLTVAGESGAQSLLTLTPIDDVLRSETYVLLPSVFGNLFNANAAGVGGALFVNFGESLDVRIGSVSQSIEIQSPSNLLFATPIEPQVLRSEVSGEPYFHYPFTDDVRTTDPERNRTLLVVGRNLPESFSDVWEIDAHGQPFEYRAQAFDGNASNAEKERFEEGWEKLEGITSRFGGKIGPNVLDSMLVSVHLKKGAAPGYHTLYLNGGSAPWLLQFGDATGRMSFLRDRDFGDFEESQDFYLSERIVVQLEVDVDYGESEYKVELKRLQTDMQTGDYKEAGTPQTVTLKRVEDETGRVLFRSNGADLRDSSNPNRGRVGRDGIAAIEMQSDEILEARLVRGEKLLLADSAITARVVTDPEVLDVSWPDTLATLAACYERVPDQDWNQVALDDAYTKRGVILHYVPLNQRALDLVGEGEIRETAIKVIPYGYIPDPSLMYELDWQPVSFGHLAAADLLRREYIRSLRIQVDEYLFTLQSAQAVALFRQNMMRSPYNERRPAYQMPIKAPDGSELIYGYTLKPNSSLAELHGKSEVEISVWLEQATREALEKVIFSLRQAIDHARGINPCENVSELLSLTGATFNQVASKLKPKLMRLVNVDEPPHEEWLADRFARSMIDELSVVAASVRKIEDRNQTYGEIGFALVIGASSVVAPLFISGFYATLAVEAGFGLIDAAYIYNVDYPHYIESQAAIERAYGSATVLGYDAVDRALEEEFTATDLGISVVGASLGVGLGVGFEVAPVVLRRGGALLEGEVAETALDSMSKIRSGGIDALEQGEKNNIANVLHGTLRKRIEGNSAAITADEEELLRLYGDWLGTRGLSIDDVMQATAEAAQTEQRVLLAQTPSSARPPDIDADPKLPGTATGPENLSPGLRQTPVDTPAEPISSPRVADPNVEPNSPRAPPENGAPDPGVPAKPIDDSGRSTNAKDSGDGSSSSPSREPGSADSNQRSGGQQSGDGSGRQAPADEVEFDENSPTRIEPGSDEKAAPGDETLPPPRDETPPSQGDETLPPPRDETPPSQGDETLPPPRDETPSSQGDETLPPPDDSDDITILPPGDDPVEIPQGGDPDPTGQLPDRVIGDLDDLYDESLIALQNGDPAAGIRLDEIDFIRAFVSTELNPTQRRFAGEIAARLRDLGVDPLESLTSGVVRAADYVDQTTLATFRAEAIVEAVVLRGRRPVSVDEIATVTGVTRDEIVELAIRARQRLGLDPNSDVITPWRLRDGRTLQADDVLPVDIRDRRMDPELQALIGDADPDALPDQFILDRGRRFQHGQANIHQFGVQAEGESLSFSHGVNEVVEIRLGKRRGAGNFNEVFDDADKPEEIVFRISMYRGDALPVRVDRIGRVGLQAAQAANPARIRTAKIRKVYRAVRSNDPRLNGKTIEVLDYAEQKTARQLIDARASKELTPDEALAYAEGVRELNRQGYVFLDNHPGNYGIEILPDGSHRLLVFDSGAVVPAAGRTAAERAANARQAQLLIDAPPPHVRAEWVSDGAINFDSKRSYLAKEHLNRLLDLDRLGVDSSLELPFNPVGGDFSQNIGDFLGRDPVSAQVRHAELVRNPDAPDLDAIFETYPPDYARAALDPNRKNEAVVARYEASEALGKADKNALTDEWANRTFQFADENGKQSSVELGDWIGAGSVNDVFHDARVPGKVYRISRFPADSMPVRADHFGRQAAEETAAEFPADIEIVAIHRRVGPIQSSDPSLNGKVIEYVDLEDPDALATLRGLGEDDFSPGQALAYRRATKALNKKGYVLADGKPDNFRFRKTAEPDEWVLQVLDPGGIFDARGGSLLERVSNATKAQRLIDAPPSNISAEWDMEPTSSDSRWRKKQKVLGEKYLQALINPQSSAGIDYVELLPFNPIGAEFFPALREIVAFEDDLAALARVRAMQQEIGDDALQQRWGSVKGEKTEVLEQPELPGEETEVLGEPDLPGEVTEDLGEPDLPGTLHESFDPDGDTIAATRSDEFDPEGETIEMQRAGEETEVLGEPDLPGEVTEDLGVPDLPPVPDDWQAWPRDIGPAAIRASRPEMKHTTLSATGEPGSRQSALQNRVLFARGDDGRPERLALGRSLGSSSNNYVFMDADFEGERVWRFAITQPDLNTRGYDQDQRGWRILEDENDSPYVRAAHRYSHNDMAPGNSPVLNMRAVASVEYAKPANRLIEEAFGGRMTSGMRIAIDRAVRELNRQGYVWLDIKLANFSLKPVQGVADEWEVVIIDPGGIFKMSDAGDGAAVNAATVQRDMLNPSEEALQDYFDSPEQIRRMIEGDIRGEILEQHSDLFKLEENGVSNIDELEFNAVGYFNYPELMDLSRLSNDEALEAYDALRSAEQTEILDMDIPDAA